MPSLKRCVATCYPAFKSFSRALESVPLSTRSLLIKTCQAQQHFDEEDTSTIPTLLKQADPITYLDDYNIYREVSPIHFISRFGIAIDHPLTSAIVLDLLRSSPLNLLEIRLAQEKGWATEIKLAETPGYPVINFHSFFSDSNAPLSSSLPHNLRHLNTIRYRFQRFRASLLEQTPIFYPRATHKNMSRSTRREAERIFGGSLDEIAIFGQDDWERIYHDTGVELEGLVEMRQKWYPSGAKPRTYFAMGGSTYKSCRFLQDFFTDLVNLFPATNHITRLRPSRLRLSLDVDGHYFIYDLSSFTSNMTEQRNFVLEVASFFKGVEVIVVDERFGPYRTDLGDLLDEYYEICVNHPELSYERCIIEGIQGDTQSVDHGKASMLGIFGNLMTCTVAHYLLVSTCIDDEDQVNVAGDDGLIWRTLLNQYQIDAAIHFVGDCAEEKTMMSGEPGAVCLKRPLFEIPPSLYLAGNVVPPNLATACSYLLGSSIDPRYEFYGLDEMSVEDRVSVVGKDLLRFLESAYKEGVSADEAYEVYHGFRKLVNSLVGFFPVSAPLGRSRYIWPISPLDYDFYSVSPQTTYAFTCCLSLEYIVREVQPILKSDLKYCGDVVTGNSDRRLALLERLGYLEKRPVVEVLIGVDSAIRWLSMQGKAILPPQLYKYCCLKDIPVVFLYAENEL